MMAVRKSISGYSINKLLDGFVDCSMLPEIFVSGLSADSRKIKPGYLFVVQTVTGKSNTIFINDAVRNGAVAVIADISAVPETLLCPVPVIRVNELSKKTGEIASRFYGYPTDDMYVIGITGTNGKSTISHILAHVLTDTERGRCGLIGTLGHGQFGQLTACPNTTPEPITLQSLLAEMHSNKTRDVVIEVSSHGLDQYRVAGVKFDMAVFTNLSRDHLDYHSTFENYSDTKQRLFTEFPISHAVVNIDDPFGAALIEKLPATVKCTGYTLDEQGKSRFSDRLPVVSGRVKNISLGEMQMDIDSPWGNALLTTTLFGRFNAYNLLAALSALCLHDLHFQEVIHVLSGYKNISGRMECINTEKSPRIVVDFAHTPDALEQVLSVLRSVCSGKLYCVFGCGGNRDMGKRREMGKIADHYADSIVLTSDNPRYENPDAIIQDIAEGISRHSSITIEPDREIAIRNTVMSALPADIILVAGKGHEDYQEISGERKPYSDQKIIAECLEQYQ